MGVEDRPARLNRRVLGEQFFLPASSAGPMIADVRRGLGSEQAANLIILKGSDGRVIISFKEHRILK